MRTRQAGPGRVADSLRESVGCVESGRLAPRVGECKQPGPDSRSESATLRAPTSASSGLHPGERGCLRFAGRSANVRTKLLSCGEDAPMRAVVACLLTLWCAPLASAGPSLKDARQRLLRGNYAEAQA